MEEYSRPATLEDLKSLVASLNREGVDYLLIGGYALFAHGYHRATTDIDVLVPATRQAGEQLKKALMVLPDQAAKDIDPEWFEEGENIRVADAFVVDIMLNACGETYETLKQYAETIDLDGLPYAPSTSKACCAPNRQCATRMLPTALFWSGRWRCFASVDQATICSNENCGMSARSRACSMVIATICPEASTSSSVFSSRSHVSLISPLRNSM